MLAGLIRFLPLGLAGLALVAAIWWIDQRGYRRALIERDMRDARLVALLRADLRRSEQALADSLAHIGAQYENRRAIVAARRAALQPIIVREIMRESRLADPALGLTPGLLDAVNKARAAGACATALAGDAACPLPSATADR